VAKRCELSEAVPDRYSGLLQAWLNNMGRWGNPTQLASQAHKVHRCVTWLPLSSWGKLEEWKGKVSNTDSA